MADAVAGFDGGVAADWLGVDGVGVAGGDDVAEGVDGEGVAGVEAFWGGADYGAGEAFGGGFDAGCEGKGDVVDEGVGDGFFANSADAAAAGPGAGEDAVADVLYAGKDVAAGLLDFGEVFAGEAAGVGEPVAYVRRRGFCGGGGCRVGFVEVFVGDGEVEDGAVFCEDNSVTVGDGSARGGDELPGAAGGEAVAWIYVGDQPDLEPGESDEEEDESARPD